MSGPSFPLRPERIAAPVQPLVVEVLVDQRVEKLMGSRCLRGPKPGCFLKSRTGPC